MGYCSHSVNQRTWRRDGSVTSEDEPKSKATSYGNVGIDAEDYYVLKNEDAQEATFDS